MTTGLLGGAFDPPHAGHLALAVEAVERFGLDRVIVLVVAEPGHKPVRTPVEERFELAQAAFAGVPLAEVRRDDHAYTVDSLRAGDFDPETTVFLVGADEFADFLTWKEHDEILDLVRLGVATRPGYPRERLEPVLAALRRPDRVELFEIPAVDVSSSDLRARLERGEPVDALMPHEVAERIVERGLYHGNC
ncbi:MAG: nicotinate (nicotinamide) nucleotide adenylyltransferase [Gaiellaceae bacterium]